LGLSNARALLEHGCSAVCLFDLASSHRASAPLIENLLHDFADAKILTKDVDVTDEKGIEEAVSQVQSELGFVDILCCFAGIVGTKHSLDVHADEWRRIIDINLTGSWLAAQAVSRKMIEQGRGGCIVFTASISAHKVNFPQPQAAYNASKGALLQLKSSLAAEWARYGIRVNSIRFFLQMPKCLLQD
jgi:sorbose reductase